MLRSLILALVVPAFALGCGSQRPQDVWAMPGVSPDPVSQEGYAFSYSSEEVRRADSTSDEDARGDLPESGYMRPRGFWRHDERSAMREAKATRRLVLVSFFAEWHDDCRRLDDDTLRDPAVRAAIGTGYVPLRIDVTEETKSGREKLKRYRVDHLPAILVLDSQGRELDRIEQYLNEERLLERLSKLK